MLCFKLDATKRAINFGGKKNSNFFALFTARRCNQEKGNEGSIENDFFHLSANLGHILDIFGELKFEMWPRLAER